MIENIAYVLYTEDKNEWKEIHNDRFRIVIVKYNPKTTSMFLCQRFHTIYCDAAFTQSSWGREIVDKCIKPCASLGKAEFYLI